MKVDSGTAILLVGVLGLGFTAYFLMQKNKPAPEPEQKWWQQWLEYAPGITSNLTDIFSDITGMAADSEVTI